MRCVDLDSGLYFLCQSCGAAILKGFAGESRGPTRQRHFRARSAIHKRVFLSVFVCLSLEAVPAVPDAQDRSQDMVPRTQKQGVWSRARQ